MKWFVLSLFDSVFFLFLFVFVILLQGFVGLFPSFVIEVGKLKDVWRADIAMHSEGVSGHWLVAKQTKKVKRMSHNCNKTNSNLWKWNLIIVLVESRYNNLIEVAKRIRARRFMWEFLTGKIVTSDRENLSNPIKNRHFIFLVFGIEFSIDYFFSKWCIQDRLLFGIVSFPKFSVLFFFLILITDHVYGPVATIANYSEALEVEIHNDIFDIRKLIVFFAFFVNALQCLLSKHPSICLLQSQTMEIIRQILAVK